MKTLVTGANGFVGSWLVRRLAAEGHAVRALLRPGADTRALEGAPYARVEGDVTRPDGLERACEGVDVVFHLAGTRRGASAADFLAVNAGGTRAVCEAMGRAGARRLVLASSLAASGPSSPGRPRVEDDPLEPQEWYGESKAEAERIAFSFAGALEVTVCRPCRILGPGDRENLVFFRLVTRGLVPRLLGPPRPLSLVDVDDVVDHLLLLGTHAAAPGQAFFCAGNETFTLDGLLREVADAQGLQVREVPVPPLALAGVGLLADLWSQATGRKLALSRKLARQLLAPGWTCSLEKSRALLGYQPKVSVRESVLRSARSYRELGWM